MSCGVDHYRSFLDRTIAEFRILDAYLSDHVGGPWLALFLIAAVMLPIAILFVWSQMILLPKFVRWWYEESIEDKAIAWWAKYGLNWLGFKHSTAVAAVFAGFAFYVVVRAVAAFPSYFVYTLPATVGVFAAIAVLGFFVSGNVPDGDIARRKYCKRFQSPAVTGFGLAIASLAIDFLITATAVALSSFA